MEENLVSLLTPMYNTDKYIHRLLDSVLSQDYPSIEMIIIDDGSTDNSKDIVKSYIQPFAEKGYTLKYVYQENQGQSVAIKNGLQLISGEFLAWPDSDDFYAEKTCFLLIFHR
jgi:glycosyltransferase involved in cell wall biosynthesis